MIRVYIKNNNLSNNLKNLLIEYLSKIFKVNKNDILFLEDESIIGGIKIVYNSKVFDFTLNNRLKKIIEVIKS